MTIERTRIVFVQFGASDTVLIGVVPGVTLDSGDVIEANLQNVNTTQTILGALAVTRGSSADAWSNDDVVAAVNAKTVLVSPAISAVPAVAAVLDDSGNVITPAVDAVDAVAEVSKPRFGGAAGF